MTLSLGLEVYEKGYSVDSGNELIELSFFLSCMILLGTLVNIIIGSHVWVEDPDIAWIDRQVVKITATEAKIETTNGKKGLSIVHSLSCLLQ